MADFKIRIEVNSEAGATEVIGDAESENTMANTSIQKEYTVSVEEDVIAGERVTTYVRTDTDKYQALPLGGDGDEALSFATGSLEFNDAGYLSNTSTAKNGTLVSEYHPNYLVFEPTDENGKLSVKLTLYAKDGDYVLEDLTFIGDRTAKQYPTRAILDGDTANPIVSDDVYWVMKFTTKEKSHTIEFTDWARPNYNAVLTYIGVTMRFLEVSSEFIEDAQTLSQSTSDASVIQYGVLGDSGSINIIDADGEMADLVTDGIINNSGTNIDLFINGKKIQTHITNDSSYNSNGNELNMSLTNDIDYMDIVKYDGYQSLFDAGNSKSDKKMYSILYYILLEYYNKVYKETLSLDRFDEMLQNKVLFNGEFITIKDYLLQINIKYTDIQANITVKQAINLVCDATQLQMYRNDDNEIRFISARPIYDKTELPIEVSSRYMYSEFDKELFLKNKYDRVELTKYQPVSKIEYNNVIKKDDYTESDLFYSEEENVFSYASKLITSTDQLTNVRGVSVIDAKYKKYTLTASAEEILDNSRVLEIKNWNSSTNDTIPYTITYLRKTKNAKANAYYDNSQLKVSLTSEIETTDGNYEDEIIQESGIINDTYAPYFDIDFPADTTKRLNMPEISTKPTNLSLYSEKDRISPKWLMKYNLCFGKTITKLSNAKTAGKVESFDIELSGQQYEYIPQKIEITLYGNTQTITFNQIDASEQKSTIYRTSVGLNSNTLLQTTSTIGEIELPEYIKSTVFEDYANGIKTAKVTIIPFNYYNKNGDLVKDFDGKGEIIEVGDLIHFNALTPIGSEVWRVTGRNFIYGDDFKIELELMEVNAI